MTWSSNARRTGPAPAAAGVRAIRAVGRIAVVLLLVISAGACAASSAYQGMNLEEVLEIGLRQLEAENWDDAIEAFETVVFAAEGLESAAPARFYLAQAFQGDEQYVMAAAEYRRFLERYSDHELAPRAALGVCRSHVDLSPIIQRDQQDTERALQECGAAALDFAGTPAADSAAALREEMWEKLAEKTFSTGEYYFDRQYYDGAVLYYEDVVENYPDTPAAPRALRKMYEAYQEIGYQEEAAEARERLLDTYPDSEAARAVEAAPEDPDAPA